MVSCGADLCLAFPAGRATGTRNCLRAAELAGIACLTVTPGSPLTTLSATFASANGRCGPLSMGPTAEGAARIVLRHLPLTAQLVS
jgi:hypothetical protein